MRKNIRNFAIRNLEFRKLAQQNLEIFFRDIQYIRQFVYYFALSIRKSMNKLRSNQQRKSRAFRAEKYSNVSIVKEIIIARGLIDITIKQYLNISVFYSFDS